MITSVERRRRWSTADKERLVASSLEPGATVSAVARAAGIHPSQLYGWRRQQQCERVQIPAAFNPVAVVSEPTAVLQIVRKALAKQGESFLRFAKRNRQNQRLN